MSVVEPLDAVACVAQHHERVGSGQVLEDALVLALHTFEQSEPMERDIEIAFWLDEDEYYEEDDPDEDDLVVLAPLSIFLAKRLGEFIAAVSTPYSRPIREVVLEPNHPDLAISANNLASVHRAMGNYDQALTKYQQALAIWKQHPEEREPRAVVLSNLGALQVDMGELLDAEHNLSQIQRAASVM